MLWVWDGVSGIGWSSCGWVGRRESRREARYKAIHASIQRKTCVFNNEHHV